MLPNSVHQDSSRFADIARWVMKRKRLKCGCCGADLTRPSAIRLIIHHVTTLIEGKLVLPKSVAVSPDMIDAEEGLECNECGESQSLPPIEFAESE